MTDLTGHAGHTDEFTRYVLEKRGQIYFLLEISAK
jgi:hypothetical protein